MSIKEFKTNKKPWFSKDVKSLKMGNTSLKNFACKRL